MSSLDAWTESTCAAVGVDPAQVAIKPVLDLAREAAHGVERPAAPLTAFILGLAVGAGQPLGEAAERLRVLAQNWASARD
jgi:hypothetical protein